MARVTVEDCLVGVDNRFELVLVAAKRARQLAKGNVESTVEPDGEKPTVLALREIAAGNIDRDYLQQQDHDFATNALDMMLNAEDFT